MRALLASIAVAWAVAGCTVGNEATPDAGGGYDDTIDDPPPLQPDVTNHDQAAFDYFRNKGLSRIHAAAIVGNLMQESNVNPTAIQYGGGPGRGIAQWSIGGRWNSSYHDNVAWYANSHGMSRWSLTAQLDFIWYELTHFGYGYTRLRDSTTVTGAVEAFADHYEICGTCDMSRRISNAEYILNHY